jgi:hypothetical protein
MLAGMNSFSKDIPVDIGRMLLDPIAAALVSIAVED